MISDHVLRQHRYKAPTSDESGLHLDDESDEVCSVCPHKRLLCFPPAAFLVCIFEQLQKLLC
jgi:hypothetical protein